MMNIEKVKCQLEILPLVFQQPKDDFTHGKGGYIYVFICLKSSNMPVLQFYFARLFEWVIWKTEQPNQYINSFARHCMTNTSTFWSFWGVTFETAQWCLIMRNVNHGIYTLWMLHRHISNCCPHIKSVLLQVFISITELYMLCRHSVVWVLDFPLVFSSGLTVWKWE